MALFSPSPKQKNPLSAWPDNGFLGIFFRKTLPPYQVPICIGANYAYNYCGLADNGSNDDCWVQNLSSILSLEIKITIPILRSREFVNNKMGNWQGSVFHKNKRKYEAALPQVSEISVIPGNPFNDFCVLLRYNAFKTPRCNVIENQQRLESLDGGSLKGNSSDVN